MSHPSEQIRFCASKDGTRIAYATYGAGPPLIFVAHWLHHLKLDWDSPIWRPWLTLLSRRHTLIRYDQRGCGLSDRDGIEFSPEKLSQDFEAVVSATRLEGFDLFAMTACARVVAPFVVSQPERIGKLVLFGTSARGPLAEGSPAFQVEETETRLKAMELGWPPETPGYGQFFTALHIPDASPEQMRCHNELLRLTTTPVNAMKLLTTFFRTDARGLLPNIKCDTLVLHARRDAILPFDGGREVAALIPGARFVPLESRNHILLSSEAAWRQLEQALDEFLPTTGTGLAATFGDLTPRERDVVELVAQGLGNVDVSAQLGISEKTVRNCISIIFSKLAVGSRAKLIVLAREAGFGSRSRGSRRPR